MRTSVGLAGYGCEQPTRPRVSSAIGAVAVGIAALVTAPAKAADGCLILLCLAAPSWRAIPQCVPPIRALLRDLARGRAFPTCAMAGAGNNGSHAWASAPQFCPPQYTGFVELESGSRPVCGFDGAISVSINGNLFSRTWWSMGGDSSTEFSPAAKAQLGRWDNRFDADLAAWQASRQVQPPLEPSPGGF